MTKDELIQYIKSFPEKPGVYLMRDAEGKIIYVGKAKLLRRRVLSYFRHSNFASPRLRKLVDTIFEQPYSRISNLVDKNIAKRQAASTYLKKLVEIGVLHELQLGKEKLFIHPKLLRLLQDDSNQFIPYE